MTKKKCSIKTLDNRSLDHWIIIAVARGGAGGGHAHPVFLAKK